MSIQHNSKNNSREGLILQLKGILNNIEYSNFSFNQKMQKIGREIQDVLNKITEEKIKNNEKLLSYEEYFFEIVNTIRLLHNKYKFYRHEISVISLYSQILYLFIANKYCYFKPTKRWYRCSNGVWSIYRENFTCYTNALILAMQQENRIINTQLDNKKIDAEAKTELREEKRENIRLTTYNIRQQIENEIQKLAVKNEDFHDIAFSDNALIFNDCLFDLKLNKTEPIKPNLYVGNPLKYAYKDKYDTTKFNQLLDKITIVNGKRNPELREYLLRILGYCIVPRNTWKEFYIFTGKTNTGKSTILELMRKAFMTIYDKPLIAPIADDIIEDKSSRNISSERRNFALSGKTMVYISETGRNLKLNEQFIKLITGESTVTVRGLYKESIPMSLVSTLIVATNHLPTISDIDDSIWERIKIVPFNNQLPHNPGYIDTWTDDDIRGIIHTLLPYAHKAYIEPKPEMPDIVRVATKAYRKDENIYQEPLEMILLHTDNNHEATSPKEAYAVYRVLASRGEAPVIKNQRNFNDIVKQIYKLDNITKMLRDGNNVKRIIPGLKLNPEYRYLIRQNYS